MRKFRGLSIDNKPKRWVYGYYVKAEDVHYIATEKPLPKNGEHDMAVVGFVEVDPETVGQFTGLKDKDGKEMDWWEGDIFARSSDRQVVGSIVYDLGCFWLDRIDTNERVALYKCVDWSMYKISDINTTPDLIKNGK